MANYTSIHTGPSIDTAVTAALKVKDTHPGRLQIVGTHCALINAAQAGSANSRTDVIQLVECDHALGREDVTGLRLATANYLISSAGNGEGFIGNDFDYEAAIEIYDPANLYQTAYLRGQQVLKVANGLPVLISEPVGYDLPKGARVTSRQGFYLTDPAQKFPTTTVRFKGGSVIAPSTSKVVAGVASLSDAGGNVASGNGPPPVLLLGVPSKPMAAVIALGDSISNGQGDTLDANGNHGFISKGLWSVNGYAVPWQRQTVGAWQMNTAVASISPRMRVCWGYGTHLLIALGTNDIANNRTLAQMQADATALWTSAKRTLSPYGKPLHVTQSLVMPRCTTAAGQVPASGFGAGQLRDQWNAWLQTQVGQGLLDAVVNPNTYVENPSTPGAWVNDTGANPTIDGVHPASAVHTLAGQAINQWAQTITPY